MSEHANKTCIAYYDSPLGRILLSADSAGVSGLWFMDQRYFAKGLGDEREEKETDVLKEAKAWLDLYFAGRNPSVSFPLHIQGSTFKQEVSRIMLSIPYGKTMTYEEIASRIGKTSARAVGGAVGHNEISIIVPCHRVVGKNGNLTGYAGGLDRKIKLLELEGAIHG